MDREMPEARRFHRDPMPIMLLRVADQLSDIQRGWTTLENLVGPRGHKFYGVIDEQAGEYHCCANIRSDDPPDHHGLEVGTLAGGDYLGVVVTGEPPAVYEQIGPCARHLQTLAEGDPARRQVEFYRREDVIELWLPVL